jgi:hypothetical protein
MDVWGISLIKRVRSIIVYVKRCLVNDHFCMMSRMIIDETHFLSPDGILTCE